MSAATIARTARTIVQAGQDAANTYMAYGGAEVLRAAKIPPMPQNAPQRIGNKKSTRVRTKEDGTKLVKVGDAIDCVQSILDDGGVIKGLWQALYKRCLNECARELLFKATDVTIIDTLVVPIAECIREKALKQGKRKHFPMTDAKNARLAVKTLGGSPRAIKTTLDSRHG